jgi:hypothetical protein
MKLTSQTTHTDSRRTSGGRNSFLRVNADGPTSTSPRENRSVLLLLKSSVNSEGSLLR